MYYMISDFLNTYGSNVSLIAGRGGLSRIVKDVGILDYELDASLRSKYFHTSLFRDQLVLTTFLCAKDDISMIGEGIKHLLKQGASALAIRNVFHLPIPESVLRYADSKNFPIILINSMEIYFEKIIYDVNRYVEQTADISFMQKEINILLSQKLSADEIRDHAKLINPSFEERYIAIYFMSRDYFNESDFLECFERYDKSCFSSPASTMCFYKHGAFLFYSCDNTSLIFDDNFVSQAVKNIFPDRSNYTIGISKPHFSLGEFSACIRESLWAALLNKNLQKSFLRYGELGSYEIIFPFAKSREMQFFKKKVLEPINEHDAENNTTLLATLTQYILSGCSMHATAKNTSQHENTVRYRLEKIALLTGLDFKSPQQLEELSLAIKIDICSGLLEQRT
ncbi:MAG: PucR family transcriptional regulator [Synergistaceae bacterium]|nr:PucR family transcriptional regulator [Synergistaceae bacterium]